MSDTATSQAPAVDVGKRQLGLTYAQALYGAAQKAGQVAATVEEFESLVDDVLDKQPKFEQVLNSGFVTPEEKSDLFDRVLGKQASGLVLNFLKVLSKNGRLDCLRAVRTALCELHDEAQGRVRVAVTTAVALEDAQAQQIAVSLRKLLGKEPLLERRIDPAVLGGVVVRVGDVVYDGSVATQLNRVREQMINRSVHEIQSRRDRFSSPAGD